MLIQLKRKQNIKRYQTERFRRPSKQMPLDNRFNFKNMEKNNDKSPFVTTIFKTSIDVVKAYFGILSDASNMSGYLGGCGSIGDSLQPYSYAYELCSKDFQKQMPLSEFIDSFKGIGHITLLNLYLAFIPTWTPSNICYYMFEIESITGPSQKDKVTYQRGGSYFLYQYGLITVENNIKYGWKIKSLKCFPEDFLCAPEHGWSYSSEYVVTFVYQDWYQLINQIDNTLQNDNMIFIFASGSKKHYRFDFVRLTNGYDLLLHENICINGKWEEINILKPKDQSLKLSALNPKIEARTQTMINE